MSEKSTTHPTGPIRRPPKRVALCAKAVRLERIRHRLEGSAVYCGDGVYLFRTRGVISAENRA